MSEPNAPNWGFRQLAGENLNRDRAESKYAICSYVLMGRVSIDYRRAAFARRRFGEMIGRYLAVAGFSETFHLPFRYPGILRRPQADWSSVGTHSEWCDGLLPRRCHAGLVGGRPVDSVFQSSLPEYWPFWIRSMLTHGHGARVVHGAPSRTAPTKNSDGRRSLSPHRPSSLLDLLRSLRSLVRK